mmetsp:Transcript_123049/g.223740  ORF Transcript_123049/g.223740 Transcript_123049/m.223740 type:complete len:256 (-) Transcript_123049:188-955(-)
MACSSPGLEVRRTACSAASRTPALMCLVRTLIPSLFCASRGSRSFTNASTATSRTDCSKSSRQNTSHFRTSSWPRGEMSINEDRTASRTSSFLSSRQGKSALMARSASLSMTLGLTASPSASACFTLSSSFSFASLSFGVSASTHLALPECARACAASFRKSASSSVSCGYASSNVSSISRESKGSLPTMHSPSVFQFGSSKISIFPFITFISCQAIGLPDSFSDFTVSCAASASIVRRWQRAGTDHVSAMVHFK